MIGGKARIEQLAIAPRMAETVALGHVTFDERERLLSSGEPRGLIEHGAGVCQGRDHQPVPIGEHLVVQTRSYALVPRRQEFMPQCRKAGVVGRDITTHTASDLVWVSAGMS